MVFYATRDYQVINTFIYIENQVIEWGFYLEYGYDIQPIPPKARRFGFTDNFAIWFGAGISIAEFWAGAILAASPVSLNLKQALIAIIIGHLIGNLLLSLIGVIGVVTGLPTMVISRKPLGVRGSHLVSALNYLQLIGWTAVMLIVGARAMDAVSTRVLGFNAYWAWILFLGFIVIIWSLAGPEKWRWLGRSSALLLLALSLWLGYIVWEKYGFYRYFTGDVSLSPSFWIALDLVVAMPVSWAPLIADYTRFSRGALQGFWGSYTGYFVSSSLFYLLGAYSNIAVGEMDPISLILYYGLGVPAMLIILFSTVTTTFLDVYSAAITYKNILPRADARMHVVFAGLLGTLLALVFPMEEYEWFLLLIGGAFVSLTAIMIADYLLNKTEYMEPGKVMDPGSDIRLESLLIWALGFTLYMLLAIPSLLGIQIPVLAGVGGRLGSTIPTLIAVLLAYTSYTLLARR